MLLVSARIVFPQCSARGQIQHGGGFDVVDSPHVAVSFFTFVVLVLSMMEF